MVVGFRFKLFRQLSVAVAILLGFSIWSATALRAEMVIEKNKILLGTDYSVFTLQRGERGKCRQACAKDKKCQSWTFIKPGPDGIAQCRLKRDITPGITNNCCVSGYKKFNFRDFGDNQRRKKLVAFCDGWAEEAAELYVKNKNNRCGYHGRGWHNDVNRHFRRCMQMGPKERDAERAGQRRAVRVCVAELDLGKKARCDHYARIAVAQNSSRVKGACGTGRNDRWSNKYKSHFGWCLGANKKEVFAEQQRREDRLQKCFAFESNRTGPCHQYAEAAILHFRKNIEKGCDLHGPNWHNNYRRHVSWCRKTSLKQRKRAISKRRLTLKTCRLFGKIGVQFR